MGHLRAADHCGRGGRLAVASWTSSAIWTRFAAPSLASSLDTCALTVARLMCSWAAMSALECPWAMAAATWCSRGVSEASRRRACSCRAAVSGSPATEADEAAGDRRRQRAVAGVHGPDGPARRASPVRYAAAPPRGPAQRCAAGRLPAAAPARGARRQLAPGAQVQAPPKRDDREQEGGEPDPEDLPGRGVDEREHDAGRRRHHHDRDEGTASRRRCGPDGDEPRPATERRRGRSHHEDSHHLSTAQPRRARATTQRPHGPVSTPPVALPSVTLCTHPPARPRTIRAPFSRQGRQTKGPQRLAGSGPVPPRRARLPVCRFWPSQASVRAGPPAPSPRQVDAFTGRGGQRHGRSPTQRQPPAAMLPP